MRHFGGPRVGAAVLLLGLFGCAGRADTTRFYVLAPTVGTQTAERAEANPRDLRVGIQDIELPRYLDRPQIVTRASANRLELAELHQWGAPLRRAVPGILAENLARLLPSDLVLVSPWGRSFVPDFQVVVEVRRFEGSLGGESELAARWRILGRAGEEVGFGSSRIIEPSGPDYESLVAAQSRLVGALSREIAEAVRRAAK